VSQRRRLLTRPRPDTCYHDPVKREGRLSVPSMPGLSGRFFFNRLILLVSLSAILVIVLGVFAYRSLATLNAGTDWVVHSQRVRYQLSHVLQLLVDMGGGVRRYEMTHDDRSFQEAEAAAAGLPEELAVLHQILADDPALQPSEAVLIDAAQRRLHQTQNMVAMARAGDVDGIRTVIEHGDNVADLNACRTIVARMQEDMNHLFESHRRVTDAARDSVAFAIVATTSLAVILLVLVAYVSIRHSARQRAVQRALMDSESALREADHRKDVFLATLSHELRNPLAPIRTAARLLESPALTDDDLQRSRLIISRQVRHMASLLDDLLDISRITRGALTLKKDTVGLKGMFEAAVETARPAIDAKHHTLRVAWPSAAVKISVDPVRFTQVVTNLLTNAAKYTDPNGEIDLSSRIEDDRVVISVRDTGIGIDSHMLTRIFEMFSQVAPAKGHADGGLGIGLALVKGLVELHGGHAEARSAGLEKGSEFLVYFPYSTIEAPAPEQPGGSGIPAAVARPLRVLIADDNRDSAQSLGILLELSGHEVYMAHDGVGALSLAAQKTPEVALLDIGMPGMDGYEVAAKIRRESWGAEMTLIAITGWGQEEDKELARSAGFDHHVTKPMDGAVLESLLTRGLRHA
jgi:signal transduction histidine kinase